MFGQISINFWAQKSTNAVLPTLCLRSKHVLPTFFYTLPPTEALQEALQALKMTWGGIEIPPPQKPHWRASQRLLWGARQRPLPVVLSSQPAVDWPSLHRPDADLTGMIIKLYYRIRVELRSGDGSLADPADYLRIRLAAELRCSGLRTREKLSIPRLCGTRQVGLGYIDLLVESVIAVIVVSAERLHPAHTHQLRLLLQDSTLATGLLFNAGGTQPDYRREDNPDQ